MASGEASLLGLEMAASLPPSPWCMQQGQGQSPLSLPLFIRTLVLSDQSPPFRPHHTFITSQGPPQGELKVRPACHVWRDALLIGMTWTWLLDVIPGRGQKGPLGGSGFVTLPFQECALASERAEHTCLVTTGEQVQSQNCVEVFSSSNNACTR